MSELARLVTFLFTPLALVLLGVWYLGRIVFYVALSIAMLGVVFVLAVAWYFSAIFALAVGILIPERS